MKAAYFCIKEHEVIQQRHCWQSLFYSEKLNLKGNKYISISCEQQLYIAILHLITASSLQVKKHNVWLQFLSSDYNHYGLPWCDNL